MDVQKHEGSLEDERGPGADHLRGRSAVSVFKVAVLAAAVVYPGLVIGGLLAYWFWTRYRTPSKHRVIFSLVAGGIGVASGALTPIWVSGEVVAGSLAQSLVGPLALFAAHRLFLQGPQADSSESPVSEEARRADRERSTRKETGEEPSGEAYEEDDAAQVKLGKRVSGGRPVVLGLPQSVERHVTVVGDTGTGKTTTLVRIMHDCLAAGYAVVVADFKGLGSLPRSCEALSRKFGVPLGIVDSGDEQTLKYNPARGTPAQISNKLIGAFAYGKDAGIYKQLSQELVPVLAQALRDAGEPVTVSNLAANLGTDGIAGLARQGGGLAGAELVEMRSRGHLQTQTMAGMRGRLGSLLWGEYGSVFDVEDEDEGLDLYEALRDGITYISLPAMASSEDSELFARVLLQDAKQAASRRIGAKRESALGQEERSALLVLDEFAVLHESRQIEALLLQAREAGISCVMSSQFLPRSPELRKSMLSAGLLISHAVGEEDAGEIARALGMRKKLDVSMTRWPESEKGEEKRWLSSRSVKRFVVEPDEIQKYGVGRAAVRIRYGDVRTVERVKVDPPELD